MRRVLILVGILLFFLIAVSEGKQKKELLNSIDSIKYETGNWKHPDYSKPFTFLGNHRFKIRVNGNPDAVFVKIPWRRADKNPQNKRVVIVNVKDNSHITEFFVQEINNEFGNIVFKPHKNSHTYYVYYLPHKSTGGYYPKIKYLPPLQQKKDKWFAKYTDMKLEKLKKLPTAKVIAGQSIDKFHSFFPMEIIATKAEVNKLLNKKSSDYYLFPEYRQYPIKMRHYLPKRWIDRGMVGKIFDRVKRGEFYTFQIGIYSSLMDLSNIKISYTDLKSKDGKLMSKSRINSFNTSGIDLNGKQFSKKLNIKKRIVQPIWFGIDVPKNISPGEYVGEFSITPLGKKSKTVFVKLEVLEENIVNHGDNQPENMSRLRWLNSRIGTDKTFIPQPFTPVIVKDKSLKILGRELVLANSGLPEKIQSFFASEMTFIKAKSEPILSSPIVFKIINSNNTVEKWKSKNFKIRQEYKSEANWSVINESNNFTLETNACLEYDGMLNYTLKLISKKSQDVSDIILEIPMKKDAAEYMLGLGRKGGKSPEKLLWKWNINFHHEGLWLGNVNKGLQYVLRDENYERPLNTNFYHNKPLKLPKSWGNNNRGGIKFTRKGKVVLVKNYSGKRSLKKGDVLYYNIRFMITPFKSIDIKKHFETRFVHKYVTVEQAKEWDGTVINVHHATDINPYINYPFYNLKKQRTYIENAHKHGIKVKLYNTIRELSYRAYELFALRSLGDEIFNDGKGGGHSWLQEHLRGNYHSAWHATNVDDAAILNKGTSRWTNYYIEGLNWLAKYQKIDGLYLDDIAFSRETTKRIVAVLRAHRDDVIIDLHSANQFNERDGFINSAFLYMEHFPYISRLWFGEYFNYNENPDYWLTEVSGIPFGLTGEMLEKGGHPFRGMVYGMTNRIYGKYTATPFWQLFDSFDIKNSKMLGYWLKNLPISIFEKDIKMTIFVHSRSKKILLAIGSWSNTDRNIKLKINWKKLASWGFDKNKAVLISPAILNIQKEGVYNPNKPIRIEKNKGLILILKK